MSDRRLLLSYCVLFLTETLIIAMVSALIFGFLSISSIPTEKNPFHPLLMFASMFGMSVYMTLLFKSIFELLPLYLLILFRLKDEENITKDIFISSRYIIAFLSLTIINLLLFSDGTDLWVLCTLCTMLHLIAVYISLRFNINRLDRLILWTNNATLDNNHSSP